jgi:hypothetical protein
MHREALYEVWFSRGDGLRRGPRFRQRADAERYMYTRQDEASFALRGPDGRWELVTSRWRQRALPPP